MSPIPANDAAPERLSPNALERRVKRWWLAGPYEAYVQVTPGLEEFTATELLDLGLAESRAALQPDRGGIGLKMGPDQVMRANLSLRTASRVLLRLGTFPAASPEMLYDRARKLPWEVHLGFATSYALRITARNSALQAGDEVAKAVSSAVSRHMRELGLYPKQADTAALEFHVRLQNDYCTISLDSSGELLHRRGVRRHVHAAPVRETLAAATVLAGLQGDPPPEVIVDPFCGSGTLLLEAAEMLRGLQPGRSRHFAFQDAAWFRPGRWREVQRQAERRPHADAMPRLLGFDNDRTALDAARQNAQQGQFDEIQLAFADSTRLDFGSFGVSRGLVVTNLPYGVRLGGERTAAQITQRFLTQLLTSDVQWRVALLCTPKEAEIVRQLLSVEAAVPTRNGGLDVMLVVGAAHSV